MYQIGVVLYEMLVGIPPYYNDNLNILYNNIEKGRLKLPSYLSSEAIAVLKVRLTVSKWQKLLVKDPEKRISLANLKKEPFFAETDWDRLLQKADPPPVLLLKINKPTDELVTHCLQTK